MNKEILKQIVNCLAIITTNSNIYSKELKEEVEKLDEMINNEKESEYKVNE